MFIVQVEINNSMQSSWSSGQWATKKVCISLNWLLLLSMNICLQMKFKHLNELANFVAKFAPNFRTWKRNWQVRNKLGNRALKSNLKSTITIYRIFVKQAVRAIHKSS
jgi:hypothetical protein